MRVTLEQIGFTGSGLSRPECVLAHRSGLLLVPDWTPPGGISLIAPDGRVRRLLATASDPGIDLPVRANGIALEPGGTVLLAHLGEETGGIYRLWPDGRCQVVTDKIEGQAMPPANFVMPDGDRRLWITVSTTKIPRAADYRPDAASGFIAVHADGKTRIAADGLGYTNECLMAPYGRTLWVNETFARRLTAFDVEGPRLSNRRTIATFGPGTFPDGLALAEDGSILVTSIVSNRVIRVTPEGQQELWLEDAEPAHLAWVEAAFQAGEMNRPHLDQIKSKRLRNISNLAFGGPDLKIAYLGCLLGENIARFDSPLAGAAPAHWTYDLGPLADLLQEPS